MLVLKRNKTEVEFDGRKIFKAISSANKSVDEGLRLDEHDIDDITNRIVEACQRYTRTLAIEEIQNFVETELMSVGAYDVAKSYIKYRYTRDLARQANSTDDAILSLLNQNNEELKQENSNKNPVIASTQRDYMAGEVSKDLSRRVLLPKDIVEADDLGIIHNHDKDYFAMKIHNCDLINLRDMLMNGTVITGTLIDPPKSFATAANVATQIVAQVASNQYGGQTFNLAHLAPFVEVTRQKIRAKLSEECKDAGLDPDAAALNKMIEAEVLREVKAGIQTIQYQLLTLMTTNGQTPFVSMYMNINDCEGQEQKDLALLIEEVLNQRIQGIKNEQGVWITPAFPKLLYVLDDNNVNESGEFFYLTRLAAKCTAKRMVPDYISAKLMREMKNGDVYACMGCRSFLTPDRFSETLGNVANAKDYIPGEKKYWGRFNQGVVTLNLVDVACSSNKDMDKFWEILDERLELCHRALRCKHERLLGTVSDTAPILWRHGALARLKQGETIDKLLFSGYSTLSLGYAGLYEMCFYMTGKSHTDPDAHDFAMSVMQKLNDACDKWKKEENIDYSVYGTPLESTTYKFAKCLQRRFGTIPGVTDHNYITNSYHVNVREEIDAFTKLSFESDFQRLSPGGAISYVEVPDMQNNIDAVISLIQFIYQTIMYAELNTKSDYCQLCGYSGEIEIVETDAHKLIWKCPNCGNENQDKMNVARRTCGYIGTQFWNQGRTQEIRDRVLHL